MNFILLVCYRVLNSLWVRLSCWMICFPLVSIQDLNFSNWTSQHHKIITSWKETLNYKKRGGEKLYILSLWFLSFFTFFLNLTKKKKSKCTIIFINQFLQVCNWLSQLEFVCSIQNSLSVLKDEVLFRVVLIHSFFTAGFMWQEDLIFHGYSDRSFLFMPGKRELSFFPWYWCF